MRSQDVEEAADGLLIVGHAVELTHGALDQYQKNLPRFATC